MVLGATMFASGCSAGDTSSTATSGTEPSCADGVRDGDETGVDCGGKCNACNGANGANGGAASPDGGGPDGASGGPLGGDGMKNGGETDVDCGGKVAPKCAEGKSCLVDSDCVVACGYAHKCVGAPSCVTHLGGDTCGVGEVGEPGAAHESCCRSLAVPDYADPSHPGKAVYLDKYEITAGRIRAWVQRMAAANGGTPDVNAWIASHRPQIWDPAWDTFLPTGTEGGTALVGRRLLGDPRPEDNGQGGPPGPGVILPPATDQVQSLGINYQFGSEVYVDLHGSDCATNSGSYGFPTYYYPPDILARDMQNARATGVGSQGQSIPAQELLDVKSMNCITNAMLAAFCAWDGGQLATDEVLDYVTATPASLGNVSGCGTQIDNHGELLGNNFLHTVQTGGQCAPVSVINATFDGGDELPVAGSPLNAHRYHYPDLGDQSFDKAWEIAAPGRGTIADGFVGKQVDVVRMKAGDEPWVDLNGNVSEAALDMNGATFTGMFALKYRGIAYGTSRSDLNMTLMKGETILRIQRPEAKAAYMGGRCMRFR